MRACAAHSTTIIHIIRLQEGDSRILSCLYGREKTEQISPRYQITPLLGKCGSRTIKLHPSSHIWVSFLSARAGGCREEKPECCLFDRNIICRSGREIIRRKGLVFCRCSHFLHPRSERVPTSVQRLNLVRVPSGVTAERCEQQERDTKGAPPFQIVLLTLLVSWLNFCFE